MGENAPATAAVEVFSASAPPKNSDPKFSHFECSDDNDSEDDVPVSSDAQHVNLKRPHPSSPSVPNEQPIRSKKRIVSCMKMFLIANAININTERVTRPEIYPTPSRSDLIDPSSSCQFVILS